MNKLKKISKFIFEPVEPFFEGVLAILMIFVGIVIVVSIGFTIVGGLLLCVEFGWPFWIGIVWMVAAIWLWSKLNMKFKISEMIDF